jgi:hypothetical protein
LGTPTKLKTNTSLKALEKSKSPGASSSASDTYPNKMHRKKASNPACPDFGTGVNLKHANLTNRINLIISKERGLLRLWTNFGE